MKNRVAFGLSAVATTVAVVIASSSAATADISREGGAGRCTVLSPENEALSASAHHWRKSAEAEETARVAAGIAADIFGSATKQDPTHSLERGLIGIAFDDEKKTYQIVLAHALTAGIDARAAILAVQAANAARPTSPQIQVLTACGGAHLPVTHKALAARSKNPGHSPVSFHLDPKDGRFRVSFLSKRAQEAEQGSLLKDHGNAVVVQESGGGRATTRYADTLRRGGARIGTNGTGCSSGFAITRNNNGYRGLVTAGHCWGGTNGLAIYSGPQYVGSSQANSGYPTYDMQLVTNANLSYNARLYTDPGPGTRLVVGRGDPVVGNVLCGSGSYTLEICDLQVTNTNGNACSEDGCTPNVLVLQRNSDIIIRPGDSGGPIYSRPGGDASIKGMIIAGSNGTRETGWRTMYAEKVSAIQAHLNVTVYF